MKRLDDFSIGTKLKTGFLVMICLTVLVGAVSFFQIRTLAQITQDLYDHPFAVSKAMLGIQKALHVIDGQVDRMDQDAGPDTIIDASRTIDRQNEAVQQFFSQVTERYRGDLQDVRAAQDAFAESRRRVAEVLHVFREKRFADLTATRDDAHASLGIALSKTVTMIDFAQREATQYIADAGVERGRAYLIMGILLALTTLFGVTVAVVSARQVAAPLAEVVARIRRVAQGDPGEDVEVARDDEIGELFDSFRIMRQSLKSKIELAEAIASGEYGRHDPLAGERDALGLALNRMSESLREGAEAQQRELWFKTGRNELAALLVGEKEIHALGREIVAYLATYLDAQVGALYTRLEGEDFTLLAGYAVDPEATVRSFAPGEGLLGQAAAEGRMVGASDVPEDYVRVSSALGSALPRHIVAVPFLYDGRVIGVLELGSFAAFAELKLEFLRTVAWALGVACHTAAAQARLRELLEGSRLLNERLKAQQEELRASNEELEQQGAALRASEEELRQQQEELQAINEELEEKNEFLEKNKSEMALKNLELEDIRRGLERKAVELDRSSRYKSEFLANMSHELRTPLNSLLLLSRNLMDNPEGNLSDTQLEFARVIHRSGNDLLSLINDILDLSKIEAGKMVLSVEDVTPGELAASLELFRTMVEEKGLVYAVELEPGLPESIRTDRQRTEQILRNFLSNALKFTAQGSVTVSFHRPRPDARLRRAGQDPALALGVTVADTGIGISEDKHEEIFEAFQQAEGGTSRKYGGTGLGLSICRELARLLGGEIVLQSAPGEGSRFTLYLPPELPADQEAGQASGQAAGQASGQTAPARPAPRSAAKPEAVRPAAPRSTGPFPPFVPDDRDVLAQGERSILIVEDDEAFARILVDQCRRKGLRALAAQTGEEGLALAASHSPSAVILDIRLPGMDGWEVLEELKQDPALRHIPVHVMSGVENPSEAMRRGAVGYLEKPAQREALEEVVAGLESFMKREIKDLLLIEDNPDMRTAIVALVGDMDVRIEEAPSGAEAMKALREKHFDCVILDLGLPDMSGFELLTRLQNDPDVSVPPVIVYTGREMSKEEGLLRTLADSIIIKGVKSEERLLDETALFLHQVVKRLPRVKRETIVSLHDKDAQLKGKTVLLVDDDMRNLFALSHVLEQRGVTVLKAEDGQRALDVLAAAPEVDMVILDVMMPVMDGYETARRIRADKRFEKLPVIALTAKAMREDREKCIEAGASDYLAKPVDLDRLLSMMRVWLFR
ncbi:multi-sensor hybrid histidine kinase [Desulfovibrio sp. X2]|uniref:response regulator n=1 Tax=Desulfovibrio sp. X2 TaxID=941449 RepID=UPI000358ED5B|nr:response regulator [Desulfovibrio sp. X2]EPR43969.1 multi-sensor hybrid histidine kinase [Desulfovibrio sp. X2]